MGLDFSHCDARWGYFSFDEFRKRLATQIGIDLDSMVGHGGTRPWEDVDDPLKPFLHHSDCDGELTVEECKQVYPRLEQLLQSWPDGDNPFSHKRKGMELVRGMKRAIAQGEPLEFL
ncbi:hypothetical protein STSP2_03145 [Anaerohalosphaera lusitana]|uniref:Uncharacterized protein n=1 Tax=Anaerohalosphaera lusitana TaxID=1936003 RepID=A0A1U9NQ48_9BACT|nr:hypothetical protein [Anaerohalosphaera lusitana]AQT69945.1 hypothetical protein STSP2_03145 [Anaerohalosphaera lusitana]